MSNMSLQTCHCGWSSFTSYQGLRTHQGKKGCTPKGMSIPQNKQFSFLSTLTYVGPPISLKEPEFDFSSTSVEPEILNMSNMSVQTCHCGWSNFTTYHGLRTHQGMMGCTPKGMSIPQSKQFGYLPSLTYSGLPVSLEEPVIDISSPSVKPDAKDPPSDMSFQGLRIHQGDMGSTPLGMRIPESEQYPWEEAYQDDSKLLTRAAVKEEPVWMSALPSIPNQMNPATKETKMEPNNPLAENQQHSLQMGANLDKTHPTLDSTTNAQQVWMPALQSIPTQMNPATKETKREPLVESQQPSLQMGASLDKTHPMLNSITNAQQVWMSALPSIPTQMNPATKETKMEPNKPLVDNQQPLLQMGDSSDKTHPMFGPTTSAKSVLMPASQTQMNPAASKTPIKETNKSFFETPQRSHQTITSSSNTARRGLDFSTGAQQAEKVWEIPTSTTHETVAESKQKEREQEKEREAQKVLKARQDRMRADLQQKIHTIEQKVADVRSSVTAYKGNLDAEWLEINSVFTEVMKVVEDARQKALQPLEQRRQEANREAKDLIQKLQKEIDMLKKNIDEVDTKPDLQVSPLPRLNDSWKNVSVDTSFSFGTLKTTTSVMIKQIQEKLEKLSSVELKRIPAFAVDVKLDPTTAHQCLVLSADGKKVRDGGQKAKSPDTPERFDAFGSVLGLNSFTSGKAYWEVEVTNKTGWDLGVVRGNANRKGELTLNPDNGYWVTVHYEDKKYAALTSPPVSLPSREKLQKVGVFVDYEEGLVSFYDVKTQSHMYSFTECSFSGPIFPYFSPHLQQNGKNVDPLIISAVHKQQ